MNDPAHILTLPILIPLIVGAALILIHERHHRLKYALNQFSSLVLLAVSIWLLMMTDGFGTATGAPLAYLSANWSAPFGIVLIGDRLSALMLVLTAVIANAALLYSFSRWSQVGVHYHTLFQLLLMGINGALLTGDLFNLFVFFEVMLAASYGLLLHGYNITRLRAGMQYIAINLVASFFFLIGIALVYAATGTLTLADIAANIASLGDDQRLLMHTGAAVLAVAFLTKSAMWPLGFWLPTTYSAAAPPVTAMLVVLTKIGIYVILRLHLLFFGATAGASAGFGTQFLFIGGLVTMLYGIIGLIASQEANRIASYSAIISSGTLLAIIGANNPSLLSSALFYLVSSTLAVAAFALLSELISRIYPTRNLVLAISIEAFEQDETHDVSSGYVIPSAMAFLGLAFMASTLVIAGLPPLSGFIAKFGILHHLLDTNELSVLHWSLTALLILAGLGTIITMVRFGVRSFWVSHNEEPPKLKLTEATPVAGIIGVCVAMVVFAGPLSDLLERVAADAIDTPAYIDTVMELQPVVRGDTI